MQLVTREDAQYLRVGQDVEFKSKKTVHPEARYRGTIVQITKHLVVIESKVIQDTMYEKQMVLGKQTVPVKYSIDKNELCIDTMLWTD